MTPTEELPDVYEAILPVAEIFTSFQGEGAWAGTAMTFVRLAGCNVGKPYTADARKVLGLQVYQERCTDWQGSSFPCDTNYRVWKRMSPMEIVHWVPSNMRHVCVTGGEPLMHSHIAHFLSALTVAGKHIHIETSGTKALDIAGTHLWITVCPKTGYLSEMIERADELKILVGNDFDTVRFVNEFLPWVDRKPVWLSPINGEHDLNRDNMMRCLALQERYPDVRLCTQLHKLWNVR